MALRYDRMQVVDSQVDDQGFLNITACPIAKPGVFPYRTSDGTVKMEAKLPDEIFSPETIASANGKPITNEHPTEKVDSNNFKKYAVGMTHQDATSDGKHLKVSMTVADKKMLDDIKQGKRELSIGFTEDDDNVPGALDGNKYDSAQRNIRINHIAIVKAGRAGHDVNLFGDSAENIIENGGTYKMEKTLVLDDAGSITLDAGMADKVTDQIKKYKAQIKEANDNKAKLEAALKAAEDAQAKAEGNATAAKSEASTAKAEADSAKKETEKVKKDAADSIEEAVNQRVELMGSAKKLLGDSADFKGKSNRDIKIEAIKKLTPDFVEDGKDDSYIDTYYDAMSKFTSDAASDSGQGSYHGDSQDNGADYASKNNLDLYGKSLNEGAE